MFGLLGLPAMCVFVGFGLMLPVVGIWFVLLCVVAMCCGRARVGCVACAHACVRACVEEVSLACLLFTVALGLVPFGPCCL